MKVGRIDDLDILMSAWHCPFFRNFRGSDDCRIGNGKFLFGLSHSHAMRLNLTDGRSRQARLYSLLRLWCHRIANRLFHRTHGPYDKTRVGRLFRLLCRERPIAPCSCQQQNKSRRCHAAQPSCRGDVPRGGNRLFYLIPRHFWGRLSVVCHLLAHLLSPLFCHRRGLLSLWYC